MSSALVDQIDATRDLIEFEGQDIALTRPGEQTRTPGGGMAPAGPPTVFDPVKRFFSPTSARERLSFEVGGKLVSIDYVLVGMPGDDIKADDTFTSDGQKFRILFVSPECREYETRAFVVRG